MFVGDEPLADCKTCKRLKIAVSHFQVDYTAMFHQKMLKTDNAWHMEAIIAQFEILKELRCFIDGEDTLLFSVLFNSYAKPLLVM